MTRWTGVAVAALLLGSVAACGDDGGGGDGGGGGADAASYCDDLKDAQEQFKSLAGPDADPAQIDDAFSTLQSLGDEAPEEVAGDWKVMTEGLDQVEQALDEAGVSLEDMQSGDALNELDPAAAQKLAQEFSNLDSQEFSDAQEAISKHAKDECGVDLDSAAGDSGS